jgi:hypothetical protein
MPEDSLQAFSESFHNDIAADAHAMEMLREEAFVEKTGEILADYGEIRDCEQCSWKDKGFKIDAYEIDEDFENLTLIISHWLDTSDLQQAKVSNSEIDRVFKRGINFLAGSLKGNLKDRIDISNPAQDLAGLIHECRAGIASAKLILITDGLVEERRGETEAVEGIEVVQVVWDIQRIHTFVRTGEREQIAIDFASDYGGAIPCLEQPSPDGKYTTYLAFVPGTVLADLYGDWKIRLLERNVRVFLSHRVKVNQGIRDTIRSEPEMFCAYNNGITVYAQGVDLAKLPSGQMAILRVHDFQIVNGGQTTASLYHTRDKYKADLNSVTVQMKLMIINEQARPADLPEDQQLADVLVPKIGRFSNTQNRIQLADLLANDPPHPELHAISKNLTAPDPTGGSVQTYWFYEKSRGSYEETRRLEAKTAAQERKFDQKYPRSQRFDKSKFGKAWNSYLRLPHIVCLGAMKNFAEFNNWLQEQKDENWTEFFKKTVALVMLWNEAEKIVRQRKFGGYSHAIVAYTLSWWYHLTNSDIDLSKIWTEQTVPDSIKQSFEILSQAVNNHIRDTALNVTEWCKKETCWQKLKDKGAPDLPSISSCLISGNAPRPRPARGNDAIEFCKSHGSNAWKELSKWLKDRGFMSGKARRQCFMMGKFLKEKREPSFVLSNACREIWQKAENSYGWKPAGEIENGATQ